MLIQAQIITSITNAQYYSSLLLDSISLQESLGEDCTDLKQNFILIEKWISISQDYLINNFDGNGNIIPATFACLTQTQIEELIAKMNLMVGCNTPPAGSDWLLATGFWNDLGFWRDSAIWYDVLPFT